MVELLSSCRPPQKVDIEGKLESVDTPGTCHSYTTIPPSKQATLPVADSPQFHDGRFRNEQEFPRVGSSAGGMAKLLWNMLFNKPEEHVPLKPIPVHPVTAQQLLNDVKPGSVIRFGHSTVLLKLDDGKIWITDPVFSERCSPFRFMGPKRFHSPPIRVEEMPPIEGVILSHDHYDHCDYSAIMVLKDKAKYFLTPLGLGDRLASWGVEPSKIYQLDWWQSVVLNGMKFVATPNQHFSGRGPQDRFVTLWASWVIICKDLQGWDRGGLRIFFTGDGGYNPAFREIGKRYGPFDLCLMENGAYNENWRNVHCHPEDTYQAFEDLRGRRLLPIHNSTFDLAMHNWYEPLDRITELAMKNGTEVITPEMGEVFEIMGPQTTKQWWLKCKKEKEKGSK